jgi:UDP-N-acetylglucosamine acyltransferase
MANTNCKTQPASVPSQAALIHPTALVSPSAELGAGVQIGPFSIIEDGVRIGAGSRILARAHLCPGTVLGQNCEIHMNAVIGHVPQDFSYHGEPLATQVGDGTVIRENVTIHGTVGGGATQIGAKCFLMAGSHVAHNCKVGPGVILANGALLAGHVEVGEGAFVSGNVVLHQFVRVGRYAMLSGGSRFGLDIPPFLIADGVNAVTTLNAVGLRRAKALSDLDRREIKQAYKIIYRSGLPLCEALARLRAEFKSAAVAYWVEFMSFPSKRGFCLFRAGRRKGQTGAAGEQE